MSTSPKSIAVIIGSTRSPRAGPQITDFVVHTIKNSDAFNQCSQTGTHQLTLIDLVEWNLPLFNEPTVPSQIHRSSDYGQPHTQKWSAEVLKHDAFIFVTPQYNWGYPAGLKNAIDYLFNEWVGKPAMIVSYGGHGGGKAAAQLKQVLEGTRMRVAQTMPALTFAGREMMVTAARGKDLNLVKEGEKKEGVNGDGGGDEGGKEAKGVWDGYKEEIGKAFEDLLNLMTAET